MPTRTNNDKEPNLVKTPTNQTQLLLNAVDTELNIRVCPKSTDNELLLICDTLQIMHYTQLSQEVFYNSFLHGKGQQIVWNTRLQPYKSSQDRELLLTLGVKLDLENSTHVSNSFPLVSRVPKRQFNFEDTNTLLSYGSPLPKPLAIFLKPLLDVRDVFCKKGEKTKYHVIKKEFRTLFDILTDPSHYHVFYDLSYGTLHLIRLDECIRQALNQHLDKMYAQKSNVYRFLIERVRATNFADRLLRCSERKSLENLYRNQMMLLDHCLFSLGIVQDRIEYDTETIYRNTYTDIMARTNQFNEMLHNFFRLYMTSSANRWNKVLKGSADPDLRVILIDDSGLPAHERIYLHDDKQDMVTWNEKNLRCVGPRKLKKLGVAEMAWYRKKWLDKSDKSPTPPRRGEVLKAVVPFDDNVFSWMLYDFILTRVVGKSSWTNLGDKFWIHTFCRPDMYELYKVLDENSKNIDDDERKTLLSPKEEDKEDEIDTGVYAVKVHMLDINTELRRTLHTFLYAYQLYVTMHALHQGLF